MDQVDWKLKAKLPSSSTESTPSTVSKKSPRLRETRAL